MVAKHTDRARELLGVNGGVAKATKPATVYLKRLTYHTKNLLPPFHPEELTTLLILWSIAFFPLLVDFSSINPQKEKAGLQWTQQFNRCQPPALIMALRGILRIVRDVRRV
jgi:hypothetical protein